MSRKAGSVIDQLPREPAESARELAQERRCIMEMTENLVCFYTETLVFTNGGGHSCANSSIITNFKEPDENHW